MSEVIRSLANVSWAMTRFGAQQIRNVILADTERAASAVDVLTETVRDGLGENWGQAFRTLDQWQSRAIDGFLPGSRQSIDLGLFMLSECARTLAEVPALRNTALELTHKIQAFRTFQNAERELKSVCEQSLMARIEQTAELSSWDRLWALEGLSFAHSSRAAGEGVAPDFLNRLDVSDSAVIPLNTGAGLSLAMRTLESIDPWGDCASLNTALEEFHSICKASATPGCELMMFEAIGLAVRTLYPHLLQRVARLLGAVDPELAACYWHGVGRALYFAPTHTLPGACTWRQMLTKTGQEADHLLGRQNALAGLAWAVTLVNFRHPEILAQLIHDHRDAIFDPTTFSHGVSSAVLLWTQANGREIHLENLLRHQPPASTTESWHQLVLRPVETALGNRPQDKMLGSIFRFLPTEGSGPRDRVNADANRQPTLLVLSRALDGWFSRAMSP